MYEDKVISSDGRLECICRIFYDPDDNVSDRLYIVAIGGEVLLSTTSLGEAEAEFDKQVELKQTQQRDQSPSFTP